MRDKIGIIIICLAIITAFYPFYSIVRMQTVYNKGQKICEQNGYNITQYVQKSQGKWNVVCAYQEPITKKDSFIVK